MNPTIPTKSPTEPIVSWDAILQKLHRQFYEDATDQCVLWVNPAQGDPFADNSLVAERRVLVHIRHPNFDLQFAPYLLPLNLSKSKDAEVFKASVQIAWEDWTLPNLQAYGGQTIAGWIMVDNAEKLAHHWATHCHLHRVNKLSKLLRFHDPSVREWLWPTLTATQQYQLMGPAKKIIAINRQQQLMEHQLTAEVPSELTNNPPKKLRLSKAQWLQIDDYATLHRAWLSCCSQQADFRTRIEKNTGWQQATFAALQQATTNGITDAEDRVLFAMHALQIGSTFYEHPQLKDVWAATQAGGYYGGELEKKLNHPADQLHTIIKTDSKQQKAYMEN